MTQHVLTERSGQVLTIRFNRPGKRNALTRDMYSSIAEVLERVQDDAETRVVLVVGQPDCFTGGNDLHDAPIDGMEGPHGRFMSAIMNFEKPLIAAPCGLAIGVGVTMLLHFDLVYMGEHTTLRAPFVGLGVCPEFGSSYLLPQLAGHQRASEILLTGEAFDAVVARDFGLATRVVPNDQAEQVARDKATLIASQPPAAVRTTKMLLKRASAVHAVDAVRVEMDHLLLLQDAPEAREAVTAFKEKRSARFGPLP